jgi:hypothetical protein
MSLALQYQEHVGVYIVVVRYLRGTVRGYSRNTGTSLRALLFKVRMSRILGTPKAISQVGT